MALTCRSGARECFGCGRCEAAAYCSSCQVAIGRGQEYYFGTFGIICSACTESYISTEDTVCDLCEERILSGEEIISLGGINACSECAGRCIR